MHQVWPLYDRPLSTVQAPAVYLERVRVTWSNRESNGAGAGGGGDGSTCRASQGPAAVKCSSP